MDISKMRVVHNKCSLCGKKMNEKLFKVGANEWGNRICNDCKKKETLQDEAIDISNLISTPEYKKQRDVWIDNRSKGIDQPSFKFKPRYITKNGKRIRIK
jgi:ribosome-binding protein aMBF1 (putative translation factor)